MDEDDPIVRGLDAEQCLVGLRREERAAGGRPAEALEDRAGDADAQRLPGDTRRGEQARGLPLLLLWRGIHEGSGVGREEETLPDPTQQREFARRIKKLADQVPVFMLVGNHDIPGIAARATSIDIFRTLEVSK